jgi:beta-glucanase (GH16 family)
VVWDPGLIVWYVDGVEIHRFSGSEVASQEMYLLANLAVAAWVDPPDETTPFPSEMVVDYIRVWQRG